MAENNDNRFDYESDFAHANEQNCNDDNEYASKGVSFGGAVAAPTRTQTSSTGYIKDIDADAFGENSDENQLINSTHRGSMFTGIVGAIVGAIVGGAAWVFCRPYGNIAYFTPILIAVLTFLGYNMMCSKKSAASAFACTLISIASVVGAYAVSLVIILTQLFSQFGLVWTDIVQDLPFIFEIEEIRNPLLVELAVALAVLAATLLAIGAFSAVRAKKAIANKNLSDGTSKVEFDEMRLHDFERDGDEATNKFN